MTHDSFGVDDLRGSQDDSYVHLLLLVLGLSALVLHLAFDDIAIQSCAWGAAILIGGIAVAFYGVHRFDVFSPKYFIGIVFALFYGLGAITPFIGNQAGAFSNDIALGLPYYPEAAAVSYFCLIGFLLGYESQWIARIGASSKLLALTISNNRMKILWLILAASGMLSFVLNIANDAYFQSTTEMQSAMYYGSVGFILNGIYVATTIAVSMMLYTRANIWVMLSTISVTFLIVLGIPTGSKTMVFIAIIFSAIAWNYYAREVFSRKLATLAMLITIGALLGLMPFNIVYRDNLMASSAEGQSLSVAFEEMLAALETVSAMEAYAWFDLTIDYATARLSNIAIVANIVRYIHEGGDLQLGLSYARMFLVFVPRFIWWDKPDVTIGRALNQEVFGADPGNVTSVGVTMVGEQVYNFSVFLAPFGMILIGLFLRWMYEAFREGHRTSPVLATGVYAFWWYTVVFSSHESNWAACFNGSITYTIFVFACFWLLNARRVGTIGTVRPMIS